MVNGLLTHFLADMLEGTELVAVWLIFLILKSIRIDSVKTDIVLCCQDFNGLRILRNVPRNVERDRSAGSVQSMKESDIFNFFFQASRFASAGKSSETRPPRSEGPAR